jgi:CheY-like chemotaxis protein
MKLSALTADMVQKAIAVYQDLAYGSGRPRRSVDVAVGIEGQSSGAPEALLAMFCKEAVETIPGYRCHRYSLRLGNRNYPWMKLVLQEHLVAGEYFFAVDTHDQMEIKPDYPDYDQWMAVRRFNRVLKRQIEEGFAQAGLDTAAIVRRLLVSGTEPDGQACRGLVLIVDDEEDLAGAVEVLVRRRGFRTYKVFDGKAGLLAAQELLPDLILLDYELPELDGLQVIQRLRAETQTKDIPVLLNSSARLSMADIKQADGFLAKPFTEPLLYEMIDRVQRVREVPK